MNHLKKTCAITLSTVMVLALTATAGNVSYAASDIEKEETVYVNQTAEGTVEEVIVSNWLKNITGNGKIEDVSNLKDIKNVKGDETFTQKEDGAITWEADNQDIYYQGTTDEKPPVGVKISYQLDGKEMEPEDLAGKSGKLTMKITYENDSSFNKVIDGKQVKLNTPFLMASAIILPVDTFSEVTISQGKIVSEGSNQILVAYGMPGISESLNLSEDMKEQMDDKLGDTVTIHATVKDFAMSSIYTVASSSEFSDIDLGEDGDLDDLEGAVNDLADATDELLSGSSDLSDGLTTLKNSFETYASGVNSVNKGAVDLAEGAGKLSKGIKQYTSGVNSLTDGTGKYITGTNQLVSGVKEYVNGEQLIDDGVTKLYNEEKDFPTLYEQFHNGLTAYVSEVNKLPSKMGNMISSQIGTITSSYDDTIDAVSTDTAVEAAKSAADIDGKVEAMAQQAGWSDDVKNMVKQAMYQAVTAGATAQKKVDKQYVNGVSNTVKTNAASMTDFSNNADITKLVQSGNTLVSTSKDKLQPGITSVTGGIKELYDGVKKLSKGNQTLLDGASTLSQSSVSLTEGIKTLTGNSKTLSSSANKLSNGASRLSKGTKKIGNATKDVEDGVAKLQEGSLSLSDGMNRFKEEGTGKLQSEYNSKVKSVMERFKALTTDSDGYNTFSGIADNMTGSVKFIFQTEEIKLEK